MFLVKPGALFTLKTARDIHPDAWTAKVSQSASQLQLQKTYFAFLATGHTGHCRAVGCCGPVSKDVVPEISLICAGSKVKFNRIKMHGSGSSNYSEVNLLDIEILVVDSHPIFCSEFTFSGYI